MRILRLAGLLLPALAAFAQNEPLAWFVSNAEVTLTAQSYLYTWQMPATGGKSCVIDKVWVYCSANCSVKLERDGTAATGTAATAPVALSKYIQTNFPPPLLAYGPSNAGAGTQLGAPTIIPGGATVPLELPDRGVYLNAADAGTNFSVRIATMTGDVKITPRGRQLK